MRNPEVLAALQAAGFTAVVGVDGLRPAPLAGGLAAAPNPFAPRTVLRYVLSTTGPVRLTVYDLAGRVVARLVDGVQAAGAHEAPFEGAGLPSGVYRCRLETGGPAVERIVVRLR